MMRMWIPLSPESDSSASGDRLTPCERANLTGFSCQPFTVLIIASMSRAEITDVEQGEKKRASFTTHAKNPSPSISHDYLWMSLAFTKQIKKFLQFLIFFFTKLLKCAWKKKYITAWFSYAKSILTIPLSKAVLPDFYLIGFLKQSPIKNCCNLVTSRSWSHLDRTSQGLVSTKSGTRGLFCAGKVQISNCLNISFMSVLETKCFAFFYLLKGFNIFCRDF